MSQLFVACSVADCGAKRDKNNYCLTHYMQFRSSPSSSPSSSSPSSPRSFQVFNPYSEFKELSRKQIQDYSKQFKRFDLDGDGEINFTELTWMMEKLGHPQTHVGLKAILNEVDEDHSGGISLREFLLIFRKARTGSLECPGLIELAKTIDVAEEGVGGAKQFFEAHAKKLELEKKNEEEIRAEQAAKKEQQEEAARKRAAFKQTASLWK